MWDKFSTILKAKYFLGLPSIGLNYFLLKCCLAILKPDLGYSFWTILEWTNLQIKYKNPLPEGYSLVMFTQLLAQCGTDCPHVGTFEFCVALPLSCEVPCIDSIFSPLSLVPATIPPLLTPFLIVILDFHLILIHHLEINSVLIPFWSA